MTDFERHHQIQTVPETYSEPFSGAKFDRAYGAMPANPFIDDAVKKRQLGIEAQFLKLFVPPVELAVPPAFSRFFIDDYTIGERRRQMTSYNNYMGWRDRQLAIPEDLQAQMHHYERGSAEVDDIFDIMLGTDMTAGVEVGRVTHPYWQRMHHLQPLRETVSKAIIARGGTLEIRNSPYRSIDIEPNITFSEDGTQQINGHLAKYKHDIGTILRPSDGKIIHIVERQIAGIRVDEASGFSQGVLRRMHEVAVDKEKFRWDVVKDKRFEYHLRDTGCRGFIEKAIQTDSTDAYIVPESTTVFMFAEDPETSRGMGTAAIAGAGRALSPYYSA